MIDSPPRATGKVYLVGAGPGDPGLLTLRGRECLARADVVLYDYLVNSAILAHARRDARLVCLGRHGADRSSAAPTSHDRIMPQAEVNRRMIEEARAGRVVCRLKGGDPAVFGRLADETAALAAAGVSYEVTPGVTTALALGSYAGIPLTHGELASGVAFVAGRERDGKGTASLDFAALAVFPGTLVFYMGVTAARHWAPALMRHGKPAETPVALVRRCSWPDQSVELTRLDAVVDRIEQLRLRPPALAIVGDVAGSAASTWFTSRRLFGIRVLTTRPDLSRAFSAGPLREVGEPDTLCRELTELGAEVLVQPAIEIHPTPDPRALDAAIAGAGQMDWIVFSSATGARAFLDRVCAGGADVRRLGQARLAAIGPATAAAVAEYRLRIDLAPETFRAESLAAALGPRAAGRRCLLVRASRGREVLAEALRAAGALVTQVVTYESRDVERARPEVVAALAAGQIDWVTVSSSAIARSLARLFGDSLRLARLASISPITSETLRELGHEPAAEAAEYTMAGLVAAIR